MSLRWILLLLAGGLILTNSGCWAKENLSEEDEHLEHHIPEHKPANLIGAWSQIKLRLGRLQTDSAVQELTELQDIINWLPETAGDSDLKRPAWEQVNQISQRLASQSATLNSSLANRNDMIALLDRNVDLLTNLGRSTQFGFPVLDQDSVQKDLSHD